MLKVYLADYIERTDLEGPGWRIAIWFSGCSIKCKGCCNPHLFDQHENQKFSLDELFMKISKTRESFSDIEGISVLGGEPFDQPEALCSLLKFSRLQGLSNMVYSGHTLAQIRKKDGNQALEFVDLLVDGPYVESLKQTNRRWIGSSNQCLHFMSERYHPSMPCFAEPNEVELRWKNGELSVYGFPTDLVSKIEKSDCKSTLKTITTGTDYHNKHS